MNPVTPADSLLGQATAYDGHYDPSRLFPIPRAGNRDKLALTADVPLHGVDVWNAYELSWLDGRGKPQIALARIEVPADSEYLIESKSLKLYLMGFMQTGFAHAGEVQARIVQDLSAAACAAVAVEFEDARAALVGGSLRGECIDGEEIEVDRYQHPHAGLLACDARSPVDEVLVSHLLKSNCPVTGQPDWASVQIDYAGARLDRAALLRYLIAFREHAEFHEHCVEQIFVDLWRVLQPRRLSVYARYTRRGGIDINPFRSSDPAARPHNPRLARQ